MNDVGASPVPRLGTSNAPLTLHASPALPLLQVCTRLLQVPVKSAHGAGASNAPMSLPSPPGAFRIARLSTGRGRPRWAVSFARAGIASRLPLSRDGLLGSSACVKVV